jgi:hypothetical protein
MQPTEFETDLARLIRAENQSVMDVKNARRTGDAATLRRARQAMVSHHLEVKDLVKAEVRKFAAELKLKPMDDDDKKVAQLLKAFATGTRLQRIFRDTFYERPHSNRCARDIYRRVLKVLDGMDRRKDLSVFLDHPDPAIRANAAGILMNMMPDRCLPILREIGELGRWVEAGSIACDALMHYSVEHPEIEAQG